MPHNIIYRCLDGPPPIIYRCACKPQACSRPETHLQEHFAGRPVEAAWSVPATGPRPAVGLQAAEVARGLAAATDRLAAAASKGGNRPHAIITQHRDHTRRGQSTSSLPAFIQAPHAHAWAPREEEQKGVAPSPSEPGLRVLGKVLQGFRVSSLRGRWGSGEVGEKKAQSTSEQAAGFWGFGVLGFGVLGIWFGVCSRVCSVQDLRCCKSYCGHFPVHVRVRVREVGLLQNLRSSQDQVPLCRSCNGPGRLLPLLEAWRPPWRMEDGGWRMHPRMRIRMEGGGRGFEFENGSYREAATARHSAFLIQGHPESVYCTVVV